MILTLTERTLLIKQFFQNDDSAMVALQEIRPLKGYEKKNLLLRNYKT